MSVKRSLAPVLLFYNFLLSILPLVMCTNCRKFCLLPVPLLTLKPHIRYVENIKYLVNLPLSSLLLAETWHHSANNFQFMYSQKRFSKASQYVWAKYFQNRIIMSCLELWYPVEKWVQYEMQQFSCKHREQHISKWSYEIALTLLFPFVKYIVGMWNWDLVNSFWNHVIQISFRQCTKFVDLLV